MPPMVYLKSLAQDEKIFTRRHLDLVLFERIAIPSSSTSAFGLLVMAYARASVAKISTVDGFPRPNQAEDVAYCEEALRELATRLASMAGQLLGDVEEDYHNKASRARCFTEFHAYLVRDPYFSRSFPKGFLKQMTEEFLKQHATSDLFNVFGESLQNVVNTATKVLFVRTTMPSSLYFDFPPLGNCGTP